MEAQPSYAERAFGALQDEGLKVTPQRRAIVDLFDEGHHHWTPQSVFSKLDSNVPSLSLATVYNTMELFERLGLVRRVTTRDGSTYFDTHLGHHHHAICEECGAVMDVVLAPGQVEALISGVDLPVKMECASIWFEGVCEQCASGA